LSELDCEFRDAPHARLDLLRREAPHYLDPASNGSRLFLTRYADVRAVIADRTLTRDRKSAPDPAADAASGTLLSMEGDEHLLGRRLVARALDTRAVESRRSTIVAIVDEALHKLAGRESFDVVADFAAPVPMRAIAEILGLERRDISQLRAWVEAAGVLTMLPARTAEQNLTMMGAVGALQACVFETIAARRAARGDDLISELIDVEANGRKLGDDEIGPLCFLVLIAGSLTTTDLIGNAVVLLLQHPDQRALLGEKPELIESAIEEVLRHDPPVSAVARHTCEAREMLGCHLPPQATVKSSLLAANHDPGVFPDPHTFRIDREGARHVAFGGGAHGCLGARLAKLEAQIAIELLFRRFPALRLAEDVPPARRTTYGFRGYASATLLTR
jgi:cytochrome P450